MKIDRLQLVCGLPIDVTIGYINPPKIKDLAIIGEDEYNKMISSLLLNKETVKLQEDIKDFDLIVAMCNIDENYRDLFLKTLNMFFKEEVNIYHMDKYVCFFYLGEIEDKRIIDENNYFEILDVIKTLCCIKEKPKEELQAGNEKAKQFMEKLKKKNEKLAKMNKQSEIELADIVSSIAYKGGLPMQNILELTVYQMQDAVQRLNVLDEYDKVMLGYWTGNIDSKKFDLKKNHWLRKVMT